MSNAERIENRNTLLYGIGLVIAGSGILSLMIGAIYIMCLKTAHVVISVTGDAWMQAFAANRYTECLVGMMLICLGTLVKWRAEDSQTALERTNRYVSYNR